MEDTEYDIDNLFSEDLIFSMDPVVSVDQYIEIEKLIDEIDEDHFMEDETNVKNKLLEILHKSYSEKQVSSDSFITKIENYLKLLRETNQEPKAKYAYAQKFSHSFKPIVKIQKNILINEADISESMIRYDQDNVNKITIFKYITNFNKIFSNKKIRNENKILELEDITRPFVNKISDVFTVQHDVDAIYMWQDGEKVVLEDVRLTGDSDIVEMIGVANIIDGSKNIKVFDANKFKTDIDTLKTDDVVYVSSSSTDLISEIKNDIITFKSGTTFNKKYLFENDILMYKDDEYNNIYNTPDIYTKNCIVLTSSYEELFSSASKYVEFLNNQNIINNVTNLNSFFKEYPLLVNESVENSVLQQSIKNYKRKPVETKKRSKRVSMKHYKPAYEEMEGKLKKQTRANSDIDYKTLLKKYETRLLELNNNNKEKDIRLEEFYKNAEKYAKLHIALSNPSKPGEKVRLFVHNNTTFPLYKNDNEWIFDIEILKADAQSNGHVLDVSSMIMRSSDKHANIMRINILKTIIEFIKDIIENEENINQDDIEECNRVYIEPRPNDIRMDLSKNESKYMGDLEFNEDMYDDSDNIMFASRLYQDGNDDDEVIEIDEDITSIAYLVKNILNLLGIKFNNQKVKFIVNIAKELDVDVNKTKELLLKKIKNKNKQSFAEVDVYIEAKKQTIQTSIIYSIFALIIIMIQVELPNVSIQLSNALCKSNVGLMGFPLHTHKKNDNNSIVSFMTCNIEGLAKNKVHGFDTFIKKPKEEISTELVNCIEQILKNYPNFTIHLDKTRNKLKQIDGLNTKERKSVKNRYWNSFRPIDYFSKDTNKTNKASNFLTNVNQSLIGKQVMVRDINGKPTFTNYCCVRKLNDNLYDDIIDESTANILSSIKRKRKNETISFPLKYVKKPKENIVIKMDNPINRKNTNIELKIGVGVEENKLKVFLNSNRYWNDKLKINMTDNDYDNILTVSKGYFEKILDIIKPLKFNIIENNFMTTGSQTDIHVVRNILFKFMNYKLGTFIGRVVNDYKIDDASINKAHFKSSTRSDIEKIKNNDFQLLEVNVEDVKSDYEIIPEILKGIQHLYFESTENIVIYKNIKLLMYIFLTVLDKIHIKITSMILKDLEHKLKSIKTMTSISDYFEQQREDSKQKKMDSFKSLSEDARELYSQFKKTNMEISVADIKQIVDYDAIDYDINNDNGNEFDGNGYDEFIKDNIIEDYQDVDSD